MQNNVFGNLSQYFIERILNLIYFSFSFKLRINLVKFEFKH